MGGRRLVLPGVPLSGVVGRGVAGCAVVVVLLAAGCSDGRPVEVGAASTAPGAPSPAALGPTPSASASATATATSPGVASRGSASSSAPASTGPASPSPRIPTGAAVPADPQATVPAQVRPTLSPVPPGRPADAGTGVTARLTAVRAVQVGARGPGETAGPALAADVRVTNGSGAAVELADVRMTASYSGQEAPPVSGPPAEPVQGRLAAGASTTGTYVFLVPPDERAAVRWSLSLAPTAPLLVFQD